MTENVVWGVKTLSQDDVKAAVLGALNSLDAKADRGAAYLVSKGGTSSNWYRVWSDGFIEQGGIKSFSATKTPKASVTFPKAFSGTTYSFVGSFGRENYDYDYSESDFAVYGRTKTGATARGMCGYVNARFIELMWYASGY